MIVHYGMSTDGIINLFFSFLFAREPACISFKDVDEAFGVARERVPLVRGRSSKDNDFPNLADVLVEASGLIAKKYNILQQVQKIICTFHNTIVIYAI